MEVKLTKTIKNEDIYYIGRDAPGAVFNITFAGITYPNPDYVKRRREPQDIYVFEYVINGRGVLTSEGITSELTAGDLYIINTKYPQVYRADRGDPFEKIWINAQGRLLDSLAQLYLGDRPYIIRRSSHEAYERFTEIRDILCGRSTLEHDDYDRIALILHRLMMFACRPQDDNFMSEPKRSAIDSVRGFIDRNLKYELTLDELSQRYYMSVNHLIRLFKAEYGITPKQYQLRRRVEQAEIMMDNTDLTIEDTAALLGFSSVQHFSAVYKKKRGISPREYRNKN